MSALHRRLLRLEAADGRRVFTHLSASELDARLRAELAAWLRDDPQACPADVRAEVLAFVGAEDAEGMRA